MGKEKEPMWAFDAFILEQYVPGQDKKLKQLVWDEAFRQTWEKTVGSEKLQELRVQAEQAPPEQPVRADVSRPKTAEQRTAG